MARTPVLVLGIGNLLWADEGFGVRCVEALHRRYVFPDGVALLDGGTRGLHLVNAVCAADRLLLLDAIDFGDAAGTLRVVADDAVPRFAVAKKMSMHQTGFADVLAAADLMGKAPREVVLVGVQPLELEDFGGGLTPVVAGQLEGALRAALRQIEAWGFIAVRRALPPAAPLLGPGLERERYEGERPSNAEACRAGDRRFFPAGRES